MRTDDNEFDGELTCEIAPNSQKNLYSYCNRIIQSSD